MSEFSSQFAIIVSLSATMLLNKTGNVCINATLRCIWVTTIAAGKQ